MDLYAYENIPNLEALAEANGIVVPRLRGYSLMSEEAPLSAERIERVVQSHIGGVYKDACVSEPRWFLEQGIPPQFPKGILRLMIILMILIAIFSQK